MGIVEAGRARRAREEAEEERKREEARNRALQERNNPVVNPWKPPVIAPVQRDMPSPYSSPALDTSAPMIDSSNDSNNTRTTSISPYTPYTPPQQSPSAIAPRPMLASLSDRLRDPYSQPDRPIVPTESRYAGPQEPEPEAPNPWKSLLDWAQPQPEPYKLLRDEQWPQTDRRQEIVNSQPEPIENRIGQGLQQGWNAVTDWWKSTPEGQYLQAGNERRDEYEAPSLSQGITQGITNAPKTPMGVVGGALWGIGDALLNRNEFARKAFEGAGNVVQGVNEFGMAMANTPIPGFGGVSASEVINADLNAGLGAVFNANRKAFGMPLLDENIQPLPAGAGVMDYFLQLREQDMMRTQNLRKRTAAEVAAGNLQANLALRNLPSGADAVERTLDLLVNRDEKASALEQQAVAIQGTDPVQAGQLFLEAQNLRKMTNVEALESQMNSAAEFAYGMVFDATNVVGPLVGLLGLAPEAQAARRAGKLMDVAPGEAAATLRGAGQRSTQLAAELAEGTKNAQKAYGDMVAPFQGLGEKIVDATRLLARTPESKAALDVDVLWRGLTNMLKDAVSKQDYKTIITTLLDNPEQLVKGVSGLSPEMVQRVGQSDGLVRYGAGALSNKDLARRLPVLGTVRDELLNLKSLAGTGNANGYEVMAEINGYVVDAARRLNGAQLPKGLPFGAASVKVERIGSDTAYVAYLDSKGNTIQRGVETTLTEAQRRVTEINKVAKGNKTFGQTAYDIARMPADIQRAIMSDVWLGMRPANWGANALGATVNLFANNAYTFYPNKAIQDYLGAKHGGVMPNPRLNGIAGFDTVKTEVGSGAIDFIARKITRNDDNAVSKTMRWLYDRPYGNTEIKLPGGLAIPFGEGAFYSRAYYVPFKRTFDAGIVKSINERLVPQWQQIPGMDPKMIQRLGDFVATAASNGGKADVANGIRKLVGKPDIRMVLKELGVAPELLSPAHARDIERVISDATTEAEAWPEMQKIFHQARNEAASVLSLSPGQPGIFDWTDQDMAQESAWLADNIARDAVKAGIDPATAQQEAKQLATSYLEGQKATFDRLNADVAAAPNAPDTWSVVMDFYHDVQLVKQRARGLVDEASKAAVDLQAPEGWANKWKVTTKTYEELRGDIAQLGEQARLALNDTLGGKTYTPRHDWWDAVENYMRWDEQEFADARAIELGSPSAQDSALWQKVMDANRQYVDNSVYDLFGAFQRFPSLENFDIVRNGMQRLESMGAQTAWELAQAREALLPGNPTAYAKLRNQKWTKYFDDGVQLNSILGKTIARNGILEQAGKSLKWTDNGAEWQLLEPSTTPGKWKARNTATNKVEEFTVGDAKDAASPFTVPKNIVDDFDRIQASGKELDKAADAMLAEIGQSAPDVLRPQTKPMTGKAIWNVDGNRVEVDLTGVVREQDGERWYSILGGGVENVPESQLTSFRRNDPAADWRNTRGQGPSPFKEAPQPTPSNGDMFAPMKDNPNDTMGFNNWYYDNAKRGEYVDLFHATKDKGRLLQTGKFTESGTAIGLTKGEGKGTIFLTPFESTATDYRKWVEMIRDKGGDMPDPGIVVVRVPRGTGVVEGDEVRITPDVTDRIVSIRPYDEVPQPTPFEPTPQLPNKVYTEGEVLGDVRPLPDDPNAPGYVAPPAELAPSNIVDVTDYEVQRERLALSAPGPRGEIVPYREQLRQARDEAARAVEEAVEVAPTPPSTAPTFPQGARAEAAPSAGLFGDTAEDLPIVSSAAPRAQDKGPFKPTVEGGQESMFDMRPTMGGKGPSYKPKSPKETVYTPGTQAKEEIKALEKLKEEMSAAWERALSRSSRAGIEKGDIAAPATARKNSRGGARVTAPKKIKSEEFPSIDTYVMRHGGGGSINLNTDKGELKDFEDFYGSSIMGRPINNLDDVRQFLQEYQNINKQIGQLQGTVVNSKQFAKMSAQEIVNATRSELVKAGFTEAEISALAKEDRRSVLDIVAGVRGDTPDELGMVAYDFAVPNVSHMMGMEGKGDDYFRTWYDWVNRSRKTGNNAAPQVADVAQHQIRSLNDLERTLKAKLPEMLRGTPNELTGAQKLRVVDTVLDWLPEFDNNVSKAQQVAEKMAGWMMLNYSDKRNIDTIMGLTTPYHYFWSRMPGRVAMGALTKPSLVNLYYEAQRGIGLENEQAGIPQRLEGTLPGPGNSRINVGAALRYAIPAMGYLQPNPFVQEDDSDNVVEKWINQYEKWGPGLNLYLQVAADMADGKLDKYYGDVLNSMVPIAGVPISTIYQGATGKMPATNGVMSKFGLGPDTADDGFELDAYRAKRALGWIAEEEGISEIQLKYADQVIINQSQGLPVGTNIPPDQLEAAVALAERGVKRAAQDRAVGRATAYTTMMSVSPYTEAEKAQKQGSEQYWAAGYDPTTNPNGSKELQKSILAANPSVERGWAKSSDTPGIDGQISALYDQKAKLREDKAKAEAAAVNGLDLGSATRGEMIDARKAAGASFQAKIDAIDAKIEKLQAKQTSKIPDLQGKSQQEIAAALAQGNTTPRPGMNPNEISQSFTQSVMYQAAKVVGKPEKPADTAKPSEWDTYGKALAEYYAKQEQYVVDSLTKTSTSDVVRDRRGPKTYTENQARELWWHFQNDNKEPMERARYEQIDRESAMYEAASKAQAKAAKQRISGGDKLLQTYLDTPKGDERTALKGKDWRYDAVIMAAYNTDVYDQMVGEFGKAAVEEYFRSKGKSPEYPGENATEEELQAYYDASDKFDVEYPNRDEINLWLNGRYSWADQNSDPVLGNYDRGTDYEQAVAIFGEDIFDIERTANEASLAGTWVQWRNGNPGDYQKLIGYQEWTKAARNEPSSSDQLATARWGINPATQNASYASPADRIVPQRGAPSSYGNPDYPYGGNYNNPRGIGGGGINAPQSPTTGAGSLGTIAGINPPKGGAPTTAAGWANLNEKYVRGAAIGAEIQARRADVGAVWGEEALAQWDAFFALPKDSEARAAYKQANPIVSAMLLTAYNPDKYQAALADGFSNQDILAWAGRPPYEGDGSARTAYWQQNPRGWEFNAYLNGRPKAIDGTQEPTEDFTYNWGADYKEAKRLFGDNIWSIVQMQRGLPDDKAARAAFYQANPQYSAWADWWYSNLPDNGYVAGASTGRAFTSYGGGGGGGSPWLGGGGGGGGGYAPRIDPRYMDRSLWEGPNQQRQWVPYSNPTPDWLRTGDRVQADPIRKWQPPRWS